MSEHTTICVLPPATEPTQLDQLSEPIQTQPRTLPEAPHQTHVTATRTVVDNESTSRCGCLSGAMMCLGGTVGILLCVAYIISNLCFFVSGLVLTIEEYSDIPDCAKPYRGWSIAMVVIYFMIATQSNNTKEKWDTISSGDNTGAVLGVSLWILAIFPGLIAGLGNRDVLQHPPANCDLSAIDSLVQWTNWVVYFNWALMGLLLFGGLVSCIFG